MRAWQLALYMTIAGILWLETGNRLLGVLTVAMILLLVIGLIYRAIGTGDVTGRRELSTRVVSWGQILPQKIVLVSKSRLPIPAIRVMDESTLPEATGGYVTRLLAKKSIYWDNKVLCRHRGRYKVGPVIAYMSDPLGLFPVKRQLGEKVSFLVLPRWVPLSRTALKLDGYMPGETRSRHRGETPPNASTIRDYVPGDPMAAIHWQASGRTGTLMTKVFEPQIQTTLWVALDLDGPIDIKQEELLVTVATSIAMFGLQQAQLRIGLVVSGLNAKVVAAERGHAQRRHLQELLAEAHPSNEHPLLIELTRAERKMGPGHVIVLITTKPVSTWEQWISHMVTKGIALRIISCEESPSDWPVPSINIPLAYGELDHKAELIERLESVGTTNMMVRGS